MILLTTLLLGAWATVARAQGKPGLRAARTLARGDTITMADVVADSGATVDPSTVVGLVARRVIREGEVLKAPGIGTPIVVRANSVVTVRSTVGGVTVSRSGVALHDAGLGEVVNVRLSFKSTVAAVVRDSTTVTIQ